MPELSLEAKKIIHKILRHKPDIINLNIDKNGWARTDELIEKLKEIDIDIMMINLIKHAEQTNKFIFSCKKYKKIRAAYGHSLGLKLSDLFGSPIKPGKYLYHGTSTSNIPSILKEGIRKMDRDHTFMTSNVTLAIKYGFMKDNDVSILIIDAEKMYYDYKNIYAAHDETWLTEQVYPNYIYKIKKLMP